MSRKKARKRVKEILAQHVTPSEAEEMITEVEEQAMDGEYLRALGCSAAVVERDIRAIRARNPITAELLSSIIADPAGFTFSGIAGKVEISGQAARSRVWTVARRMPWLESLLNLRIFGKGRGGRV